MLLAALALVALAAFLAVPSLASAVEDKSPPQITAFSLAPSGINTESAEQTVSVTMTLTDDLMGVACQDDLSTHGSVFVRLSPTGGSQFVDIQFHRISGDGLAGVYAGSAEVPKGSMGGVWRVSWLMLVDMLGNRVDLTWQDLEAKFGVGCASLSNAASVSDSSAPEITAFGLSPKTVNTEAGEQTISATMTLRDDVFGVACQDDLSTHGSIFVRLTPIGGTQFVDIQFHRISGDGLNGTYSGTATLPKGSAGGVWRVTWLLLVDMLGNRVDLTWQDLEAKFGVGCAGLSNAASVSDSSAPEITAFGLTPSEVNTESADQTISVTMSLTDDLTGVACQDDASNRGSVFVRLAPLVGTQFVDVQFRRVSGDGLSGVYTGTATVPRSSKEGVWGVSWLMLVDMLGNRTDLDADSLSAKLQTAEGVVFANTATAQQVTIDRLWTISTAHTSVTFPVGTIVTRADSGRFAFYQMAAQEFTLDDSVPTTDLDGVPVATLRFGIPGLNLSFSQPVAVSMAVGAQYDGYRLNIQSLTEDAESWANEKVVDVTNGRCRFTVSHATRFAASVAAPILTKFTPTSGKRGATITIAGKGFGKKRGTSLVRFGSMKCAKYVSWSSTRIKCKVPAKARFGRLKVKLVTSAGTSNAKTFTVKR